MSDEDANLKPSDIVKENKKRAENCIFNKVREALNIDAEHIEGHRKWRSPMTPHQYECIQLHFYQLVQFLLSYSLCQQQELKALFLSF